MLPHGEKVLFRGTVIVDACCLVNLYASRRIKDILPYLATRTVVTDFVAEREAIYVNAARNEGKPRSRIAIDLAPLVNAGLLTIVSLEAVDEAELFVQLAGSIDDGEAITGAVAITRQMMMATDDRRATKILRAHTPGIRFVTTPEIIKHWVDMANVNDLDVQAAISGIRQGAIFTVQRGHPLTDWWRKYELPER